MHRLVNKILW